MRYVYAALVTIVLIGGCSSSESGTPATRLPPETVATTATTTTTTAAPPTTTTLPAVTECEAAMETVVASFDALFNRIDADPVAFLEAQENENTLGELFEELGGLAGSACRSDSDMDHGMSTLIVYLSQEGAARPELTAAYISGALGSLCEPTDLWTLDFEARAVCAAG